MRKLKLLFACLLMAVLGIGQMWAADATITWSFKTLQTTSGTQDGVTWETGKTGSATATACNSSNGLVLYGVTSGGGYFQTTSAIGGTITNVNIVSTAKKNTPKYTVYCSTDGSTWDEITSNQTAGTKDHAVTGSYTYVKVANTTAATAQLAVTSITVTYTTSGGGGGGSTPSVSVDPASWDFGSVATDASASKVFSVSGSDLEAGTLTLTAPSGYSVSPATITVASAGSLDATNVTVSKNTATAGTYDANLTISGCGLEDAVEVALSMEVKAEYTVTWNNNGTTTTTQVLDGDKPVFPATPESCDATSTTFIGWATAAWTGKLANLDDKTVYTSASAMPAVGADVTYYAVFAKAGAGGGAFDPSSEGGDYKIYAQVGATKYYATGANASKIGTTQDESIANVYTFAKVDENTFTISLNGNYLKYNSSTNLAGSTTAYDWTISSGAHGATWRLTPSGAATRALAYQTGGDQFGAYATSNIDGSSYYDVEIEAAASYEDYMTTCCTKYNVNIAAGITNGSVSADPASACEGTTVTLTFTPSLNYHLSGWTLNGTAQDVNNNTFTMPAEAVTVSATFAEDACTPLNTPSVTVSGKAYPYNAVQLSWSPVSFADAYKVYIYDAEDKELEKDEAFTGVVYTIGKTLSGSTTYKYSVQAVSNTPTAYCPSTAATGTFVTDALPTAHLTLVDIDGTHASSGDYAILTPFNLPATAAACAKTFVGWDADVDCATAPTYAKGAEFTFANTTCVTLYAVYADAEGGNTDVEFDVEDYADANNWSNSVAYTDFTINGVNFKANGGGNNGKYYTSDHSWRMYNGGSVVLTAASGNIIAVSSTPSQTFTIENGSASLSLSATVKFTAITVTVAADAVYSNYSTTCTEQVATPTFGVEAGTYYEGKAVTLTCATEDATIYYTTDGTTPTSASTEYTTAIDLSARAITTIKAIAVKAGMDNSEVAEAEYNINLPYTFTEFAALEKENNKEYAVMGIVSSKNATLNSGTLTYAISANGSTDNEIGCYKGLKLNKATFESADDINLGDNVTVVGTWSTQYSNLNANNWMLAYTARVHQSYAIAGELTNSAFNVGDAFEAAILNNLYVVETFTNGYSETVDGATINAGDKTVWAAGETTLTVYAKLGDEALTNKNFAVTVSDATLVSIALKADDETYQTKTSYYEGQTLVLPTIVATLSDNNTIEAEATYVSGFDNTTAGVQTVTVSFERGGITETTTYNVTVIRVFNNEDAPHTVADAKAMIEASAYQNTISSTKYMWVRGIVSNSATNKNYYISDDGSTTNEIYVYSGSYFGGEEFTSSNRVQAGDEVIVKGTILNYQGNKAELTASQVVYQLREAWLNIDNVAAFEVGTADMEEGDLTIDRNGSDGEITFASEDETVVTIVEGKLHAVAPGTVNVTANMAATANDAALNYAAVSTKFSVTVIAAQTRYKVTFAANGGEGDAPVMEDQLEGATFNLPANTFTYTGFQFAGWNDGTTTYGAGAEYTMPAQAVTFKAQWNAVCPWASVYTSNVSFAWTGESGESNSKVKINDTEYVAQKVGSGDKTGSVTVTVPAGTHTLHFHAAAWNLASSMTIAASGVNNMSVSSFAIAADAGVKNSGTYTLAGDPIDQHFHFTFNPVAEETVITFSKASGDDNRFVMYGINQEGGPELQSITIGGNATNTEYVYGQTFNPAGLTVSAVYRVSGVDQDPVDVTDRVVWTFDPAAFNSTSQTTVTATATFETKSASKTVNVTVSEPATPNVTYTAIVVKKGDKYYAMGQTLSSGALNAVELEDVVNGKMVNVPVEDRTALTWIITETEDGATFQAQNGKYLSGNGSNTTLSWSTKPVVWAWNDTYGCYAIGGRSFYMYNSTTQFKNFALSNMNNTPSQCSSKPENLSEYIDIDNKKEIVTLRSGLEKGKIGTMCWNAAIYEVEGAYFFEPEAKKEDGVCFAEAGGVYPAGKPYVFQATGEEIRAVVSKNNTTTVAGTNKGLHGTFERIDVPNGEGYYIIYQNKLYTANNNYIEANRAYIDKSQLPGASSNPAPGRRRLVIGRDNLPTGVDAVVLDGEQVQKVLIDGQIYIVRDGKMYDLTGRMIR